MFIGMIAFITTNCGFAPLHKNANSMEIFKNIEIEKEETPIAFLIQEALLEKAPFTKGTQNSLRIKPTIKNSYGVITTENEITRYSVTLDVDYSLFNAETKKVRLKIRSLRHQITALQ